MSDALPPGSESTLPLPPRSESDRGTTMDIRGQSPANNPDSVDSDDFPEIAFGDKPSNASTHADVKQIPGYRLDAEIGRGGMGVVYKAVQIRLKRVVAVKMIAAGVHAGESELARFHTEAEVIAGLSHPNIVQIFEVGQHGDIPFISLEFCPDGSLDQQLKKSGPLATREAAGFMEAIARAIHVAHLQSVIHRDLKPANILLQFRHSERLAAETAPSINQSFCSLRGLPCTPKITDFGLAKNIGLPNGATHTGVIMGTPSYMSPEQASGRIHEIAAHTDVYALGAILYECLTGRPPFVGATPIETVRLVNEQQPAPPRVLNRNIDADIEKIVLKCLEKQPAERYGTAEELAEDLRRYRSGEPIRARSVNLFERFQRELAYSQHDALLRPWGNALIILGLVMLVGYFATSLMLTFGVHQSIAFWVPRLIMIASVIPILKKVRPEGWLPTNAFERVLWAVWLGYFVAYVFLVWVMWFQGHDHLEAYGVASILAGLGWFTMGGYVWGGCYLYGWIFMGFSLIFAKQGSWVWAPFAFGCVWAFVLVSLGLRYRKLGRLGPDSATNRLNN